MLFREEEAAKQPPKDVMAGLRRSRDEGWNHFSSDSMETESLSLSLRSTSSRSLILILCLCFAR